MKLRFSAAFGAGFLLAVLLGFGQGKPAVECQTGDLTRGVAPTSKSIESLFGDWIHQVRACKFGEYLIVAPLREDVPDMLVSRNGKPFVIATKTVTMVMDEDRVVYNRERGRKASFAGYNPAQRAWIEYVDLNADGTIDWRTTDAADRPLKHEVRLGDRWLDVVKQNGKAATIVDGRFMSIEEARQRLGVQQ